MATIPEDYLKQKMDDAYALMLRKSHVRAGVERGLRAEFDAEVDLATFAEHLDHVITNDIETSMRGKFMSALSKRESEWEPPSVRAVVEFLAAGEGGEWEKLADETVDLGGYVGRMTLNEIAEMVDDWDRFAEEVGHDMAFGGYVEAPEGWELAVCRRPEGLDEYMEEMKPCGR